MSFSKSYAKAKAKQEAEHPIIGATINDRRDNTVVMTFDVEEGESIEAMCKRANIEYCKVLDHHNCGVEDITLNFERA